jgi:hypothetical protein
MHEVSEMAMKNLFSKMFFIILILAFALLASGCQTDSNAPDTTPFVGGNTALLLSYGAASPPEEIFDDGQYPFSVNLKVENKGEYDLEDGDGYIELEGISSKEFGLSSGDLKEDIPAIDGAKKGISGTAIDGFSDVVEFSNLNYQPDIAGTLGPIPIRAVACYNYETQATANLCIKEESIDDVRENEVCQIAGDKEVENSGAPVQIKSVKEAPQSKSSIQVQITIGSVGPAMDSFYKEDTECDNKRNNPDRYVVFVEIEPIINGAVPARCAGLNGDDSGYLTLFDGQDRTISCAFDTSGIDGSFETRMNMMLRYRYSQFIEKNVIIRDVTRE